MEQYESRQQQIHRSAAEIFPLISDFTLLTPALQDKVEEWQATSDTCSFKVKGFTVRLRMVEREPMRHVKVVGDGESVPLDFAFWIQLHEVEATDTRMRLVLHADLNMMLRMMIGGKIQQGLEQAATGLAEALNRTAAPTV